MIENLYLCFNPEFDSELNLDLLEYNENSEENNKSEIDNILDEFEY